MGFGSVCAAGRAISLSNSVVMVPKGLKSQHRVSVRTIGVSAKFRLTRFGRSTGLVSSRIGSGGTHSHAATRVNTCPSRPADLDSGTPETLVVQLVMSPSSSENRPGPALFDQRRQAPRPPPAQYTPERTQPVGSHAATHSLQYLLDVALKLSSVAVSEGKILLDPQPLARAI